VSDALHPGENLSSCECSNTELQDLAEDEKLVTASLLSSVAQHHFLHGLNILVFAKWLAAVQ
jgi:hypothetical protein